MQRVEAVSGKGCAVKPSARYSTLQDLDAGRHTEIDMFSGVLIRMEMCIRDRAYAEHVITLHAPIKVRRTMVIDGVERTGLVDATAGRIIFNNPVPQNLGYIDRTDPEHWLEYEVSFRVTKKTLPDIISRCMTRNGTRT